MKRKTIAVFFAILALLLSVAVPGVGALPVRYVVLDTMAGLASITDFALGRVWEGRTGPVVTATAIFTNTGDMPIEAVRLGIVICDYFDEVFANYKVSLLGEIQPGATDSLKQDVPLNARRTPLTGFIWVDAVRLSDRRLLTVPSELVDQMIDAHLAERRQLW